MNPMTVTLDAIAIDYARRLGRTAPGAGLPRNWRQAPAVAAVFLSAPIDLRQRMVTAYTVAYDTHQEES